MDFPVNVTKCALHIGAVSNEKVIPFTAETLIKCRDKQQIRQQTQKKSSRFDKIVLPLDPDGFGYHASCYRYFTASVKSTPRKKDSGKTFLFYDIQLY